MAAAAGLLVLALSMMVMLAALPLPALPASVSVSGSAQASVSFSYDGQDQDQVQDQDQDVDQDQVSPDHHPTADGAGVAHEFLEAQNRVRAEYGVPPLRWSAKLARYARRWCSLRRFDCVLMHSPGSPYGENVFWSNAIDCSAADAVAGWASESAYFDWSSQTCHADATLNQSCGHFTQLVWNDTEFVGCGRSECFVPGVFITCSYYPGGNYKGEGPLT